MKYLTNITLPLMAAFFLLLSLSFSHPLLAAQDSKTAIEFACVTWDKLPYPELFYRNGKSVAPLTVSRGFLSPRQPIKGTNFLEILTPVKNESGEPEYQKVGEARLVANSKQMLFLISLSGSQQDLPLQVYGLDDSSARFPLGSFRFLNFTPTKLKVTFNGKSDLVNSQSIAVIPSHVAKGGGFLPFTIATQHDVKLFETKLYGKLRGRETVVISPPRPGAKQLTTRFLSETVPPPPSKPATGSP